MADSDRRARQRELLEAMRQSPDVWPCGRALRFYQANGWTVTRTQARADLKDLAAAGHLEVIGPNNHRAFRARTGAAVDNGGWQTAAPTANRRKHRPR
ncbi:hypothetical protein KVH22_25175 [Streptomyces olivaceus]|uniref:hypothetical protein n=1 Tax=Streptomyces TaxID=1883 RepID=UPI001CCC18FA|nr:MULTISPECIES: hypothetical protein [Streptomyces]MBZ6258810.1 hypothetical protein [Streptomyces olivaceus]MCM8548951.1 hypothetical protein [Streptomyces sp. STCH 565 A]